MKQELTWTQFLSTITTKGLLNQIQYVDHGVGRSYEIFVIEGSMEWLCYIKHTASPTGDEAAFVNTYLPTANKRISNGIEITATLPSSGLSVYSTPLGKTSYRKIIENASPSTSGNANTYFQVSSSLSIPAGATENNPLTLVNIISSWSLSYNIGSILWDLWYSSNASAPNDDKWGPGNANCHLLYRGMNEQGTSQVNINASQFVPDGSSTPIKFTTSGSFYLRSHASGSGSEHLLMLTGYY